MSCYGKTHPGSAGRGTADIPDFLRGHKTAKIHMTPEAYLRKQSRRQRRGPAGVVAVLCLIAGWQIASMNSKAAPAYTMATLVPDPVQVSVIQADEVSKQAK